MHGHDFLVDVDVNVSDQVSSPKALSIGIDDGLQIDNLNTAGANRLLIFSGYAKNVGIVGHDDNLARGVFRVRLRFPLPKTLIFKASATLGALAGLHGEGDEDSTFAADAAITVTDPTDGGTLPQPPKPLPNNELYVIIDAAYQGDGSKLTNISYQANVLIQDLEPDLFSILVRITGEGDFGPSTPITIGQSWEYQITLTGPVITPTFSVPVKSGDQNVAPLATPIATLNNGDTSGIFPGGTIVENVSENVVITATGKHVTKTALLTVERSG